MDLKEVLTITIPSVLPTLMVLFGILSNKNDINHVRTELSSIRGEISGVRNELRAEMNSMRNQFHADINGLRSDIATLVGITNDLDKRVSRLEDKG
jgi:chromosome segregation ATPase